MTIYLDIILIENLIMNYIILFTVSVIMKMKIKQYKIIISSLIGSIYAIMVYMNITKICSNILMKILLSISMCYLAYNPKNLKKLLKELLMFYLISFVFGGCTIALMYIINPKNVKLKDGVFVGIYPLKIAVVGGILAFIITLIAFKINQNRISTKNSYCKIRIFLNKKNIEVTSLIDSGNMLKEPINNLPVIVVEKEKIKEILPEYILNNIEQMIGGDANYKMIEQIPKIRIIPFESLGTKNGMLIGIKPDKIQITYNEIYSETKNAIIGIYNSKLSKTNKYNALIGLEILERRNKDEFTAINKK